MKRDIAAKSPEDRKWLLFFYTVPSKPVSSRVKVWRRLMKIGAVQLKGAVYILPFSDEHHESLQWLVSEIAAMKGEAAFVSTGKIDTMKDEEIISLFDAQREETYKAHLKALEDFERRLGSIRKGSASKKAGEPAADFEKIAAAVEEARRIDFFSSRAGTLLAERVRRVRSDLMEMGETASPDRSAEVIKPRNADDYQGRLWLTRKKPFVDRMASAWFIRRYIDADAGFGFIDEKDIGSIGGNSIAYDMRGAEFTHTGEFCTLEVLVRSFGVKDRALKRICGIVHDLDIKDDKYNAAEARGLEDILCGIRKTAKDDMDMLEKGMAVFEMIYMSKA